VNVKYDFKPGGVEVEQGMGEQISRGAGDQVRHQSAVPEFFHIAAGVVVDHNRIASFANLDAGVRIGYYIVRPLARCSSSVSPSIVKL
jgi:hypothetical protein